MNGAPNLSQQRGYPFSAGAFPSVQKPGFGLSSLSQELLFLSVHANRSRCRTAMSLGNMTEHRS